MFGALTFLLYNFMLSLLLALSLNLKKYFLGVGKLMINYMIDW